MLQVYLSHRDALLGYAAQITGSRAEAEDVVQDAYVRLMGSTATAGSPHHLRNPAGYLYKIVRNLCLDTKRRSRAQVHDLPMSDPTWNASADEALLRDEVRCIEKALTRLPERTRTAFELHRLHGYTLQETAAELNVSAARVHQMIQTAMLHCAAELRDGDVDRKETDA
ncbi:Sigma-24 (FecI) [Caenispirillum salinarum AK4]|uniref:Sigma-24 (FecI) n=1 Tax=Caenispirillum salinarum AK4 TaxID=1238182 RepID=K9GUR6_9PROT|nr:sigma-70 family RNA polymerase sigma factor [Caenispirillum salinarum]EKV28967.1 Sigma-24 (FecI) [Caenispirillum salinarum AK4]